MLELLPQSGYSSGYEQQKLGRRRLSEFRRHSEPSIFTIGGCNLKRGTVCSRTEVTVRTMRRRTWIATAVCVAIAITLLYWFHLSTFRPSEKAVLAAQDEVYEAVVRDMITPARGQSKLTQLVFGDAVLTDLRVGEDMKSCEENARKNLALENSKLPYDSLADKIYRIFARSSYDDSLRADTIQDFLKKSCTVGRLSETFRTDLTKTLIAAESVHFEGWPVQKDGAKSFEQLFPGASGIISFSRVGFGPTLDEAIVSTSFVCGGLCGSGSCYVLRKKLGRWQVVNKWIVWVS